MKARQRWLFILLVSLVLILVSGVITLAVSDDSIQLSQPDQLHTTSDSISGDTVRTALATGQHYITSVSHKDLAQGVTEFTISTSNQVFKVKIKDQPEYALYEGNLTYKRSILGLQDGVAVYIEAYDNSDQLLEQVFFSYHKAAEGTEYQDIVYTPDNCFIATAAFGSKFEPSVVLLRQFRDRCLLTNLPGQAFVRFYYMHSPPLAVVIAQSGFLKILVRVMLIPAILMAYVMLNPLLGLLMVIALSMLIYWKRHRGAAPDNV